jgi:hypothetical protein
MPTPTPLRLGKGSSLQCTGGWVGPRTSLDGFREEKMLCTHRSSTPDPSSPGQSLYQLHCPSPLTQQNIPANEKVHWWGKSCRFLLICITASRTKLSSYPSATLWTKITKINSGLVSGNWRISIRIEIAWYLFGLLNPLIRSLIEIRQAFSKLNVRMQGHVLSLYS